MSSCFHDKAGVMVGLDAHIYYAGPFPLSPPPLAAPVVWPHLTGAPFTWLDTNDKTCATVTSEGWNMAQGGYGLYFVPHVPFLPCPPPSTLEIGQLALVIAISSSKAYLAVSSVKGEGSSLACCLAGPIGINANCKGIGVVYNDNSVVTVPSYGDLAGAITEYALDAIWSSLLGKVLPSPIGKYLFNRFVKPHVVSPLIKSIRNFVDEAVDSAAGA